MKNYEIGEVVTGRVTGIKDYGIFVSLNNAAGLIHISEISDMFVRNISDYAKVGKDIVVKVIGYSDDGKLRLSIRDFNKRNEIVGTALGFSTISNNLNSWIDSKYTEIQKKTKNH